MSRKRFEIIAWITYLFIANTVGATSVLMEHARSGSPIASWQPFVWEYSSGFFTLLLIPAIIWVDRHFPLREKNWKRPLFFHCLATIPFSLIHVAGMVALRKVAYAIKGHHYDFGNIPVELFYEYRKDFLSYFFVLAVIYGYRLYRARTEGASYETEPANKIHFVVKKNGHTLRVSSDDIAWIEAAGNYVLLHVDNSVHPLRDTMKGINQRLGPNFLRIHRSAIVNLSKVRSTQGTQAGDLKVFLDNGAEIKCSRTLKPTLEKSLSLVPHSDP